MSRVAGQVTAIQTGLLDGLLEPYTGGQKLQTLEKRNPNEFDKMKNYAKFGGCMEHNKHFFQARSIIYKNSLQ